MMLADDDAKGDSRNRFAWYEFLSVAMAGAFLLFAAALGWIWLQTRQSVEGELLIKVVRRSCCGCCVRARDVSSEGSLLLS